MKQTNKQNRKRLTTMTEGRGWGKGRSRWKGLIGTKVRYKINKLQGWTIQDREYSQYFTNVILITVYKVYSIKIIKWLCCTHEINIVTILQVNYISIFFLNGRYLECDPEEIKNKNKARYQSPGHSPEASSVLPRHIQELLPQGMPTLTAKSTCHWGDYL